MQTRLYRNFRYAALLCFSCLQLAAQTNRKTTSRIDSLQKLIAKAPDDTSKVKLYFALIDTYSPRFNDRRLKSPDSLTFFQTIETCRQLSKQLNYSYGYGYTYLKEADYYYFQRNTALKEERLKQAYLVFNPSDNSYKLSSNGLDTASKIDLFKKVIPAAQRSSDIQTELWCLKNIADQHGLQGKYELAIEEFKHLLNLQKTIGSDEVDVTLNHLDHIYAITSRHKEALEYAIAALDFNQKSSDTARIWYYYLELGHLYYDMHSYDKSIYYYNRSLASIDPDDNMITNIIFNTIHCYLREGRYHEALTYLDSTLKNYTVKEDISKYEVIRSYMDVYYFLGDYREAEKYILKVPAHTSFDFSKSIQLELFTRAAQIYLQLHQFKKAATYCDTAYKLSAQVKSWQHLMENCETLYKLDSVNGNYELAMKHYKEFKQYSDLIHQDISDKRTMELSVQYETDQKNRELQFLAGKDKLQQKQIRQAGILRNTMIAGSALLMLLLFVIYNRYRLKQRTNRKLELQQNEIAYQNTSLQRLVNEKDWLVKEIHHRVKNNLQTVMGLLGTQAGYLKNEEAINAMAESQHRIQSMSLIHQRLYQSGNLTSVKMTDYIHELVNSLSESYNTNNRIRMSLNIEPIELGLAHCIPIGLILNEAITNSFKYAFPAGRKGDISVAFVTSSENNVLLTIRDNGIGLPPDVDTKKIDSMGMNLMRGLSAEIGAEFIMYNDHGTNVAISFVYDRVTITDDAAVIDENVHTT